MRSPLPCQKTVLESTARVRVVRATPGSGKTWLVAELIRCELKNWTDMTSGIAALSFTRVGGDEIRKAVGCDLDHPHFVGTLDAFLFRFVVRPFLQKCYPLLANPRLIPSQWGAENWVRCGRNQDVTVGKGINLFSCTFIGEQDGQAVIAHKPHSTLPLSPLSDEDSKLVKQAKWERWKRTGMLTHSDAAMWASKILTHGVLGAIVRNEIVRRFPLIIVDELQDTGYFLGKCIRCLLDEPNGRGILVGDPDQAIYEFNGARPDLFDSFESVNGAVVFTLPTSQRCPPTVAAAASHLKDSGGTIGATDGKVGSAYLIRYTDMVEEVPRVIEAAKASYGSCTLKVVARQTSTVTTLLGRSAKVSPRLGCPPIHHLQRAVISLRQGYQSAALAGAQAAINLIVFGYESVLDTDLKDKDIDPDAWKALAVDCLLSANSETIVGSLFAWQSKVGRLLEEKIVAFGLPRSLAVSAGTIKPKRLREWDKECAVYIPQSGTDMYTVADVSVTTVHAVKGETHDLTIFVCPPTTPRHCPSVVWWSEDSDDREEKRIAYVAMTRTQRDLIVCVHDTTYQRLITDHKEFVDAFECLTATMYRVARA